MSTDATSYGNQSGETIPDDGPWVLPKEAAAICGVDHRTINRRIAMGIIPAERCGGGKKRPRFKIHVNVLRPFKMPQ